MGDTPQETRHSVEAATRGDRLTGARGAARMIQPELHPMRNDMRQPAERPGRAEKRLRQIVETRS